MNTSQIVTAPKPIRVSKLANDDFGFSPAKARHIIDVNSDSVRDLETLKREYKKLADSGWFVKGTTFESVIYHELGHRYASYNKINSKRIARSIMKSEDDNYVGIQLKKRLSRYSADIPIGSEIISEVFSAWLSKVDNRFAIDFMEKVLELR